MKLKSPALGFLMSFFVCSAVAQVGIGTTEPSSMLDVNGGVRVRTTDAELLTDSRDQPIEATYALGTDEEGNMVRLKIGDNLLLEGNSLRANNRKVDIGDATTFVLPILNNLRLLILPGEVNEKKEMIRVYNILGDMIVTGIEGGTDGEHIYILPMSGSVTFLPLDIGSLSINQILTNGGIKVFDQYEVIELIYDGNSNKWIIIN